MNVFVNQIIVKVLGSLYLVLLYLIATLFFFGVGNCAKFHVLLKLIGFLVLFHPCLQLVYFKFSFCYLNVYW